MNNMITTNIEILGKPYPIKCPENELQSLQAAAEYLHKKMLEIQESGKAINLERIAIIAALNITYEFLQQNDHKSSLIGKVNQRIAHIQDKLDGMMNSILQTELVYTSE
jgi:cell division protein ZapA